MRECWINVYSRVSSNGGGQYLGWKAPTVALANEAALGPLFREFRGRALDKALRSVGIRYRLHVRLKVPALPVTDALAAVKAGEDENGRAA